MLVTPLDEGTAALSHAGTRYEPDGVGVFDVPAELGEWLVRVHGWVETASNPAPVGEATDPDAAPVTLAKTPRKRAPRKTAAE